MRSHRPPKHDVIVVVLGYPPELDVKTLGQHMLESQDTEVNLVLTWKCLLFWIL